MTPTNYEDSEVQEVMKEVGVDDKEAILAEAIHHDEDSNQHLEYEELKSAAEMVAATQEIQQVIENTESVVAKEPALEIAVATPTPVVKQPVAELRENQVIDIDVLVEQATSMIRNGEPKSALELLSPHLKTIAAEHAGEE